MERNIYFIESPTQLMNAIDSKGEFLFDSILIINEGDPVRDNNKNQIRALIDESDWSEILKLKHINNKVLYHFYMLFFSVFLFFKYKKYTINLFIGDYRNFYFRIFAKIMHPKREILLDDGAITIVLQQKYFYKGYGIYEISKTKMNKIILMFYFYIYNVKDSDISPPDLYSIFRLNDFFYKSQINYRKSYIESTLKLKNDDIYFIGGKYSESGVLLLKNEVQMLELIYSHYSNKGELFYIPHRDDSKEKINIILEIGFIIKNFGKPIELYFKNCEVIPKLILGFYSTALCSLYDNYNFDDVVCFDISNDIQNEEIRNDVLFVYSYYKKIGMSVKGITQC